MRWRIVVVMAAVSPYFAAQTAPNSPSAAPATPSLSQQMENLQTGLAKQQVQLAEQQRAIAQQQLELESLRKEVNRAHKQAVPGTTAELKEAVLRTSNCDAHPVESSPQASGDVPHAAKNPLSFKIGGAEFTPGGFVDFESVFRTTNSGSVVSTNFGVIPFSNTAQGHLSEFRATAQYSRISLRVNERFGANDVTGYAEIDFNGNDAGNAFDTTNPHTNRLRVYWLDLKRGKWEFTAGQAYGWLTPNRYGVGPAPAELMTTNNEDGNIQVGLPYTRAAQFRVAYHPSSHLALGVGIENPQQFVGPGEVLFPAAFTTALAGQFDANGLGGANTTPNLAPDVLAKAAYDTDISGRHLHLEATGLLTSARVSIPTGGGFRSHSSVGGGGQVAAGFEIARNLRAVANAFWSDGGGRYANGLGPTAVVRPSVLGNDVSVSMVHAGSGLAGLEFQATPNTLIATYYGADYFQRNSFSDTSAAGATKPMIGFGGANSPLAANRSVQEATIDLTHTFWRDPQYGSLLIVNQASYLTRSPWFVPAGLPKNAHLFMNYVSLRYVLP